MREYHAVVKAVREGTDVTEEELKYALTMAHYFLMRFYFDGKQHLAVPMVKTRDKMERNYASFDEAVQRDLESFLKGSSMEPGISEVERRRRIVTTTATVGARLFEVLTDLSETKS